MKRIMILLLLFTMVIFTTTPSFAVNQDVHSMMDIRELQTYYYEIPNKNLVLKAVINTLQDNGFVIQNIEDELGYITARKDFRAFRTDKGRIAKISAEYVYYGALAGLTFGAATPYLIIPSMHMKNELSMHPVIVDVNVTVEQVGKRTKVRFNLVEKILENADGYMFIKSAPRKVIRYYNKEIYQEFFKQVDKNIFIESNKI